MGCVRLADGTYRLLMRPLARHPARPAAVSALAVLRQGSILGSDRVGAVFTGSHAYDCASGLNHVRVALDVPPDAELITGFSAGSRGAVVDIVAALEARCEAGAPATATAVVDVAGAPLELTLAFLAPLPAA